MVVTNNKETSKSNKEDSKSTGNIKGTGQDKTKENYKYFLKGWCRHGLSGRVEKDEVKECLFTHPPYVENIWTKELWCVKKGVNVSSKMLQCVKNPGKRRLV